MPLTTDHMCYFRWLSVLKGLLAVPNSHKPSGTFIHRCIAKKCDFPGYFCFFPIMFSTSFVFCRLRAVTTPRQLPPGLVFAVSSSTCGAPCLRPCSRQLVELGKSCSRRKRRPICQKVSRRGVDDQPCCWKGHRGCLTTKNGHQTRKMHFSVEFSHVRL